MEEANKNLQNLLRECREKNIYYTQKLNEQKAKEKELNFENLYRKPSLSNNEVKSVESNKKSLDHKHIKEINLSPDTENDYYKKNSQLSEENFVDNKENNIQNKGKNYLYNHANEIYDSHEDEDQDEMKYTEENKQDPEDKADYLEEEISQNDENYLSEEDKNTLGNNEDIDSQGGGQVELENDENYRKEEYIDSKFSEVNRYNKYESAIKPQNTNNQSKDKANENIMPNTFFSNQEKIKNNLQTNMPLKITDKNIQPVKDKVQKNSFQNENSTQNFNNVNNNLKYSGRSYSEESQIDDVKKPERLNKYDLSLSEDSFSESSDKIKSKLKSDNINKNLNRSSDSEGHIDNPKDTKNQGINDKPKLTIHQKIGAVPIKPSQKEASINTSKVKGTHHTAYTFSTIVKMKKEEKPNKTSVFKDKVLGKKYNGKSDRVAIYQYLKNEWNKTPILKKNTTNNTNVVKEEPKEKSRENTLQQKVKNIRRPISYYKKF